MPQAVGTAVLGEVGLASVAALDIGFGLTGGTILGYSILTAATGSLTFTLTTAEERTDDSGECDPQA
ncbi:hypothetical protein ABIE45_000965 [Methylobacterium sp. OAE515]|uniref:hypothetical protein n=1 Tax=Methylobacterium sp. OAE515 TaxID=2817895 RepID=UPI001789E7CD